MFRKRKPVSPFYRMPPPVDVRGVFPHSLNPLKKPYARFVLTEELTTSTESAKGAILTAHQWGPGDWHCPDVIVHIHNLLDDDSDPENLTYKFSLAEGGVGMAVWDRENHWRMIGASGGGGGNSVATTTEIIPKREDLTPGGPIDVIPYMLVQDTETGNYSLAPTGEILPVFSWIKSDSSDPSAEEGGVLWIFIEQDANGIWWFTGQDCPSAGY